MQYLYGSAEAAALSRQAYSALTRHVVDQLARRGQGERIPSVVLDTGATLAQPRFVPCGDKRPAVVLDVDETALLNLGYEHDEARRGLSYDEARWAEWERTGAAAVLAVPGAVDALAELRVAGVTVIFNSNRVSAFAAQTAQAIANAGLGKAVHGETLFLKGDDATGSAKDTRRALIASRWCVLALAGDQLGDISDLFNAPTSPAERRRLASEPTLARYWGAGWFLLPNPVYGSGLKGGWDDVFPLDRRWTPQTNRGSN